MTIDISDAHRHRRPRPPRGTSRRSDADAAARKYFGDSGAGRDPAALAEYYRSRKMACVVFTVDERLSGRPHGLER